MTTTVSTAMNNLKVKAFGGLAVALSLIVYFAGLVYAGVRSYTLFAATIDPDLLALAIVGIVALEVSAVALPLAIHFWTQPGAQRFAAMGFYLLDLALIAANAILDAAHHSGAEMSAAMTAYGVYGVPALPLLCMAGWSLIWLLDPASRERDMRESVKAATHEALLSQIQRAVEAADITASVENAANEAARALVGETLGSAPRRGQLPSTPAPTAKQVRELPVTAMAATIAHNADAGAAPTIASNGNSGNASNGNRRKVKAAELADPKE